MVVKSPNILLKDLSGQSSLAPWGCTGNTAIQSISGKEKAEKGMKKVNKQCLHKCAHKLVKQALHLHIPKKENNSE